MIDEPALIIEDPADGVRMLTFNRPEAHNAIDMATCAALDDALVHAATSDTVRAIVLTGSGGRAFSAGFDIREMADFDAAQMTAAFETRDPVVRRLALLPCPVIAAIDGICFGAGALMALASDIRIATPAFRFKVTAGDYGSANATWSLAPLVGPARAKEILMLGSVVEAEEALRIGLVNRVVESDRLAETAIEMAAAIASKPPEGIEGIKTLVNAAAGRTPEEGWQAEHEWMRAALHEVDSGGAAVFDRFLNRKN